MNSRESVIALIRLRAATQLGRAEVLETRAAVDGPNVGRTQLRVRAYGTADNILGHSWWAIDWQKFDGTWLAIETKPLWVQYP